uniref:receptor-interacting serine/threonine-protein kinase 2-like n=1 Tax=Myxine glutinosa TaxID=7769 RepID=UPI00358FC996
MATPMSVSLQEITERDITDWHHVGRGGFSHVFKGRHEILRIPVAVKHFFEYVSDEEARNLLQAQSNHVIRLVGLYKEKNCISGLVLEWMPHGSLELFNQRIEAGWPLRLRILYEVALGMNYLHQQHSPMLHLDLKTANVLLDKDLYAKISDFGLAKVHRSIMSKRNQNKEMSADACGTVPYMAPEMLGKEPKPSTMCDIYSYAILIWAVMTRQEPFEDASTHVIKWAVQEPKNVRPVIPNKTSFPVDLISLMERCWCSQPRERPSFADCVTTMEAMQKKTDEIKKSVENALENMPSVKHSSCPPPRQNHQVSDTPDAKSPIQESAPDDKSPIQESIPGSHDEVPQKSASNVKPTSPEPPSATKGTPSMIREEPEAVPSRGMAEQAMAHNAHCQKPPETVHVKNFGELQAYPPYLQQHTSTFFHCSTMENVQIGENNTINYWKKKKKDKKKEPNGL